jgi:hypothetical protein
MPAKLKIKDLLDTYNTIVTPLNEVVKFEIFSEKLEEDIPFSLEALKGSISGVASVFCFNAKDDSDSDNVIAPLPSAPSPSDVLPPIQFNSEYCWLKYGVNAALKGSAQYSNDELDIGIEAGASLSLLSYRAHTPTKGLGTAIVNDALSFPVIFNIDDVKALAPGEATVLETTGKLKARATFSYSDVISNNIALFSNLLSQGELLNIKLDASVSAKVEVVLDGGFKVIFSNNGDLTKLAIKKSSKYSLGASITAGFDAQLADPEAFKNAYTAIATGVFGMVESKLDEIKALASFDNLSDQERQLVGELMERLGLSVEDQIEDLKKKISDVESKIKKGIEIAANTTAKLSFEYEYDRLTEFQSIIEADLTLSGLESVHQSALFGRVKNIVDDGTDIKITRFFYQKSTLVKHAWGFNLGFGSWSAMGKDTRSFKTIETRNRHGHVKLSTIGLRGYESDYMGEQREFSLGFDATMPEFKATTPDVSDFELGFTLIDSTEQASLDGTEFDDLIDSLAVWGLTPSVEKENISEAKGTLKSALVEATDIKLTKVMKISHETFVNLLPALSNYDVHTLANCLAAALPIDNRDMPLREAVSFRKALYSPLFVDYLNKRIRDHNQMADAASSFLRRQGYPKLARQEKMWRNVVQKDRRIAGVVHNHRSIRTDLSNLCKGFLKLQKSYTQGGSISNLKDAFRLFDDLGEQGYYNRFLAHLLIHTANESLGNSVDLGISGVFEFKQDGKIKSMPLALSTSV